jgi:hypothetical protein
MSSTCSNILHTASLSCKPHTAADAAAAATSAVQPLLCRPVAALLHLFLQGFFLALQAAWLVNDQRLYHPPGQLYKIDLQDGGNYKPETHMLCKGPSDTGLSTFVLEGGGGSPGVQYAALVDELAAAGRR